MPFQYSCFISYAHGQEQLIRRFIEELEKALKSSLEPYLDQKVYIDEDRHKPGDRFNPKIARALCQSVCMILVYVPKYGQHSYCVREYVAMESLEEQRRALLGKKLPAERGFIIPIVLRGRHEDLPPKLKGHIHYADFSRYTTASSDIGSTADYVKVIDDIANSVYELYQDLASAEADLCTGCEEFKLPAEGNVKLWQSGGAPPGAPFPLREPDR